MRRREFVGLLGAGGLAAMVERAWGSETDSPAKAPHCLDHIILGCADLDRGIAFVEGRTGVRAAFGGMHPGRGTHNALLSLGTLRYLEILAPDPAQGEQKWFPELKALAEPKIVGWAIHPGNLPMRAQALQNAGLKCSGPTEGSRKRAEGVVLHWKTVNLDNDRNGLLPFLIEWNADSRHPSEDAPKGSTLEAFYLEATKPEEWRKEMAILGVPDLPIREGNIAKLVAQISGARGRFVITS